MHICFFGASVSEQDRGHATGNITGYVTYYQEILASEDIKVSRVTSGSNSIDDAGVVYLQEVIDLKPDICFLDWITPAPADCAQASIDYIYSSLLENKILPVTALFPRKDRNQRETPICQKLLSYCKAYSLPVLDLTDIEKDYSVDEVLRDTVHTSEKGAGIFAEKIHDFLSQLNDLSVPVNKDKPKLFVSKVPVIGREKNKTKKITITLTPETDPSTASTTCSLFLEQRVGPWSTFVEISLATEQETKEISEEAIFDPWCWRERQCLKGIAFGIEITEPSEISITQSDRAPNYGSLTNKCDFSKHDKHIRPKGELFLVSNTQNLGAVAKYY
ncbi:MAG: hypothetical protein CMF25_05265 [Kangiellaceae bacterium]|nr:hypothetical protein [Kangiellaceae bacterium]|tara:strand:- start:19478 stop:20473 length:996 start_codon:yes stop_codon:yes gene_type:complete